MDSWLNAVDRHPETIDTDLLVAAFLAQRPDRLWSLSDVLHGLHHVLHGLHQERELTELSDAVDELVSDGFLETLVYVSDCDEVCDGGCSGCRDPLRGDMLFQIRLADEGGAQ